MKDRKKYKILYRYYYNINILLWWIKSYNNFFYDELKRYKLKSSITIRKLLNKNEF